MCGIFVQVKKSQAGDIEESELASSLIEDVARRGPDGCWSESIHRDRYLIHAVSSVLHLRGSFGVTKQPLKDTDGNLLCFNGQIWQGLDEYGDESVNDGLRLFRALNTETDSKSLLARLRGPWAIFYFNANTETVIFGRDCLGRRSLMYNIGESEDTDVQELCISSIALSSKSVEVPATNIIQIKLSKEKWSVDTIPWKYPESNITSGIARPFTLPLQPKSSQSEGTQPAGARQKEHFEALLRESIGRRCNTIPSSGSVEPRFSIMFSGGLDSAVIARIADLVVPSDVPIELLNVAFENPPIKSQGKAHRDQELYAACPDRQTGRRGYLELLRASSSRRDWRFVEINVSYSRVLNSRDKIIQLMRPNDTEMDLSIAMAFFFVSEGSGERWHASDHNYTPYQSRTKVLLSGLGADEQLGGYGRHMSAFKRDSWAGLAAELSMDLARISDRNLGRDDRVISHHGREVRYPFLDENVISFLSDLPVNCKLQPNHPIDGTKTLLRELAEDLGLRQIAWEKKRAIQFGARTARMDTDGKKRSGIDKVIMGGPQTFRGSER